MQKDLPAVFVLLRGTIGDSLEWGGQKNHVKAGAMAMSGKAIAVMYGKQGETV